MSNSKSRLLDVEHNLRPNSLVGSFFLGDETKGYQGCVVAEPRPGIYLVEFNDWIVGNPTSQALFRIEDMMDWTFYDNHEWRNDHYREWVGPRWEIARQERIKNAT